MVVCSGNPPGGRGEGREGSVCVDADGTYRFKHPGAGAHDVQPPKLLHRDLETVAQLLPVCHVGVDEHHTGGLLVAARGGLKGAEGFVGLGTEREVGHHDVAAVCEQQLAELQADTRAAAGDQRGFAGDLESHCRGVKLAEVFTSLVNEAWI